MSDYFSDDDAEASYFAIEPRRALLYAIAGAYFVYAGYRYYNAPENGMYATAFWFIHAPLHELGHLIPGTLHMPEVCVILGGTVFQLLTPIIAGIVLMKRGYRAGWAVGLGWLGCAAMDMAVYMEDARDLKMPLAAPFSGGGPVEHDWNTLFDRWGVMVHAYAISDFFAVLSYLMIFGAAAAILLMILRGCISLRRPVVPPEE